MNEIDGYISKENSYKLTVKDKIEYTKVDVKDEIKSASEVAPAEDAEVDNVEVEAVIQDTVETVDSTCTPSKVGAGDVDTSNFPKASVGGSTKVDIAQAAVTASAKRVGYHATGNEGETVPSTATKEPKSSETQQPSEGGADKGDNTGNQGGNSQGGTTGGTTGSGDSQGGSSTGGTEEPKPNPEPSTYDITITHIFYKSDGTTKADKADEKETVTVAKGAKTVTTKNLIMAIRHYLEQHWILLRVQKNIISNGLPPQQILLPTK